MLHDLNVIYFIFSTVFNMTFQSIEILIAYPLVTQLVRDRTQPWRGGGGLNPFQFTLKWGSLQFTNKGQTSLVCMKKCWMEVRLGPLGSILNDRAAYGDYWSYWHCERPGGNGAVRVTTEVTGMKGPWRKFMLFTRKRAQEKLLVNVHPDTVDIPSILEMPTPQDNH